jgi:hypothetical protein
MFTKMRFCLGLMSFSLVACVHHAPAVQEKTTSAAKPVTATPPVHAPVALPERQELPLVLRETLSASMNRHGEELTFLLANVILLQYGDAAELAQILADEPGLGRAAPGDLKSLNALLPEAFFGYQAELRERAKTLAVAARAKDDTAFVKAFSAVAETCVGCHSSYLHDPLQTRNGHDEPFEMD